MSKSARIRHMLEDHAKVWEAYRSVTPVQRAQKAMNDDKHRVSKLSPMEAANARARSIEGRYIRA